jgi:lactobin A/cerein 7B family class IIb bacteriocin
MTSDILRGTEINELTGHEIESVSGGVLPIVAAVAIGVGKGFIGGVGVAAAVHVGANFVRRLQS